MIENLLQGFASISAPATILALMVGILLGYLVGALPGMTSAMGMALLIPFTFTMDAVPAIVMLVAIYMAADYAGAIPAILVNAPGQPAAAVTAFDGHVMSSQGKAAEAISLSLLASAAGAAISLVFLIVSAEFMSAVALAFGPAEYFALAVLGLSLVGTLASGPILKGLIGLFFGLTVVTIGIDPVSGVLRYVYVDGLIDGIGFIPALIGLFAVSEVLFMVEEASRRIQPLASLGKVRFSLATLRPYRWTILRSSAIGYFVGVVPGAGSSIASLVSYAFAKRADANPDSFGKGNPAGVVASEAANNSAVSGALAPMLALGIPGSASAAVLIGALMIQGLQPGPLLFKSNPEIPYSIFASLFVGLPIMLLIGLYGGRLWVKVTLIPKGVLAAIVGSICIVGAYASNNDVFSVWIAVTFGIIGYALRKIGVHPAPVVLALVLGDMMESNLRRAIVISSSDYLFFLQSPLCLTLLLLSALILGLPLIGEMRQRRRASLSRRQAAAGPGKPGG